MGIFDKLRGDHIKIHVIIKGRIGDGWKDVDEYVRLPKGTTLARLLDIADEAQLPLREAIAHSPHLRETMMINGERVPIEGNEARELADGDEIYLLAPLAGG